MNIPQGPDEILNRLTAAGFQAYAVGGCVRDSLLGTVPGDWDICTSALPEETEACFSDLRVVETGLKHGTVTVIFQGVPYEITTFRSDGNYLDHRRPQQVNFVRTLKEDLLRRDFTINAMAVGLDEEIQDPFGGRQDLTDGIIRCVGNPDTRFTEDALRILRGLRFASRLGFSIAPETAAAVERNKNLLSYVSGERIYKELTGILIGTYAQPVLEQYGGVLAAVLPEIQPSMGFLQRNPFHNRDVWQHTLEALGKSRPDPIVRWALLLHDLGKPDCFTLDDRGIGHFYGHPQRSMELAKQILDRFHGDKKTRDTICLLVRDHDREAPATIKNARRWIARYGRDNVRLLLEVKRCDCLAHVDTPKTRARYNNLMEMTRLIRECLETERCFSVRDLPVKGGDVMALGVPAGPQVGRILEGLLDDVLDGTCPPEREALLERLKQLINERKEP
ncbi:MAG: HD domain-containing protein [Oscillospiraceae bacterium]|nr:HD domain-containing protein [Oscillospiraceae bacterium]